jgi:hypothetical protein
LITSKQDEGRTFTYQEIVTSTLNLLQKAAILAESREIIGVLRKRRCTDPPPEQIHARESELCRSRENISRRAHMRFEGRISSNILTRFVQIDFFYWTNFEDIRQRREGAISSLVRLSIALVVCGAIRPTMSDTFVPEPPSLSAVIRLRNLQIHGGTIVSAHSIPPNAARTPATRVFRPRNFQVDNFSHFSNGRQVGFEANPSMHTLINHSSAKGSTSSSTTSTNTLKTLDQIFSEIHLHLVLASICLWPRLDPTHRHNN